MKENHFNPGLYGDCPKIEKPIDKMTFDDAVAIVLGQARQSDFHDEVVEQACQMIETWYKDLTRVNPNTGERLFIVPEDKPKGFVREGDTYTVTE